MNDCKGISVVRDFTGGWISAAVDNRVPRIRSWTC